MTFIGYTTEKENMNAERCLTNPIILSSVVEQLLLQKEWVSVLALRQVVRDPDAVISSKLEEHQVQNVNQRNKAFYEHTMFETMVSRHLRKLNKKRRHTGMRNLIYLYNRLFTYMVSNYHTFIASCYVHLTFDTLVFFLQHEPLYERQAVRFLKQLFPYEFYYNETLFGAYSHYDDMNIEVEE